MLGNILFVGLNTTDKQVISKLIKECHVGGITLYGRLYKNYEEMLSIINYIKRLSREENYNVLIGIDQEGYRVNRLPKDFLNIKSPYSMRNDPTNFKESADIVGTILNGMGIHVNFAPVLDIKRFSDNHAIGDRAFGDNPETIIKNTDAYIEALKKKQVIPVVKHFPGHGATNVNTHYFLPIILDTDTLFKEDLIPFKNAINKGIDVVMVGHFLIKNFSLFKPASISDKIVNLLRNDLKYDKLIMTDDLTMGMLRFLDKARMIKTAINSGFNIIMIKYSDNFFKDYKKLVNYYNKNKINHDNINHSIKLINDLKQKYSINDEPVKNVLDINKINERITKLNNNAN